MRTKKDEAFALLRKVKDYSLRSKKEHTLSVKLNGILMKLIEQQELNGGCRESRRSLIPG